MSVGVARDFDEAEKRIEEHERELARVQAEETVWTDLESRMTREQLKRTLTMATVFASIVSGALHDLASGFDNSLDQMAKDLNGDKQK